jgi:hypothetical protein
MHWAKPSSSPSGGGELVVMFGEQFVDNGVAVGHDGTEPQRQHRGDV